MGTSSRVGILKENKIHSVRVNFDGYLQGVGEYLLKYYDTEEKVDELIKGGEIRSIQFCYIEYYNNNTEIDVQDNVDNFIKHVHKSGCEYYYVMENGKWFCGDIYGTETPISHKFILLSDAFEIMKKYKSEQDEEYY